MNRNTPRFQESYQSEDERDPMSQTRKGVLLLFLIGIIFFGWKTHKENSYSERVYVAEAESKATSYTFVSSSSSDPIIPVLNTFLYDQKMLELANLPPIKVTSTSSTSTLLIKATSSLLWPVKTVYPIGGALLPFNRIIAYYGNFYSKKMGVLGEYEESDMLARLQGEVNSWRAADPNTPVIPAIHYIAAVAQADKGSDGDYLARMPHSEIDKAIAIAKKVNGIVFLDIQIGHSTVPEEVNALQKYLMMPEVHLGLDPEFALPVSKKPGDYIGSLDARDVNNAAEILAKIVRDNNLPPKILIVHRFTQDMITNYKNIKPLPEVQIVMQMDGWGSPERKIGTYQHVIYQEPVQFTGFKLFYKNDIRPPSTRMLTPAEILKLRPQPIYIQYQ